MSLSILTGDAMGQIAPTGNVATALVGRKGVWSKPLLGQFRVP